jgi:hypothetical protein
VQFRFFNQFLPGVRTKAENGYAGGGITMWGTFMDDSPEEKTIMTNADRIRSMSDEELAEFLIDLADDGNLRIREWLQTPAEEDDHD